ncbi:MAG: replication restart DNA helicase PriA [Cyanobacteria bacterium J06639_18]
MRTIQEIRCPNCGSEAERHHIIDSKLTRTQCSHCDYLMVTCSRTNKVIEAYAPGIYAKS